MPVDAALEARVRELCAAGAAAAAAEALVRGYGGEVYWFLRSLLSDADDADDAFGTWSEHVWRDLPAYRGEASLRTWAYAVARHAALTLRRGDARRRRRLVPEGEHGSAAAQVAWQVRSSTSIYRRSSVKDRVRALREQLSAAERELLVLRVDRELEWSDIAVVVGEDAATLRKRFERTKAKLKLLAERAGLLGSSSSS